MRKNLTERQAEMRARQSAPRLPAQSVPVADTFETPYTVREIANMTGYSVQTIIRLFVGERGVLVYQRNHTRKQRASYRNIRVPRYVYRRVMQKYTAA